MIESDDVIFDCDCEQQIFAIGNGFGDFVPVEHEQPDGERCPRKSGQLVPHAGPCGKPCISGDGEVGGRVRCHYPSGCTHCNSLLGRGLIQPAPEPSDKALASPIAHLLARRRQKQP